MQQHHVKIWWDTAVHWGVSTYSGGPHVLPPPPPNKLILGRTTYKHVETIQIVAHTREQKSSIASACLYVVRHSFSGRREAQ